MRILSETWTAAKDSLTINASGLAGGQYNLSVWGAGRIATVEGAGLVKGENEKAELVVDFPKSGAEGASYTTISIHFGKANQR